MRSPFSSTILASATEAAGGADGSRVDILSLPGGEAVSLDSCAHADSATRATAIRSFLMRSTLSQGAARRPFENAPPLLTWLPPLPKGTAPWRVRSPERHTPLLQSVSRGAAHWEFGLQKDPPGREPTPPEEGR